MLKIKNLNKGFTLIELLVVIAIIGVLASVVLVATSSTRARGNDTAIVSNLATVKLQAEIVSLNNKCYGDKNATVNECTPAFTPASSCDDTMFGLDTTNAPEFVAATTPLDPLLTKALLAAINNSGADGTTNAVNCSVGGAGSQSYAIAVPLKTEATDAWCIDSEGFAGVVDSATPIDSTTNANGTVFCIPKP